MFRMFLRYFKPHMKLFVIDIICAVMVALIDLAFPLVSRYAMKNMLPNKEYRLFFILMISMIGFYVLRSVCQYVMTYWGHTFGTYVEADLRNDLFQHLQTLDFDFYDQNRTGQLMSRLTGDLFSMTELAHHGPEDLIISVLTIVGALIFMFRMQWKLAVIILILLPISVLVVMRNRKAMAATSVSNKKRLAEISADIESGISGVRTSKAFANEEVDYDRFDASNKAYSRSKSNYYKAMANFNSSQEFFMSITPVVVIMAGGVLIMKGQMNYVDLITFTLFANSFITPIRKLAQFAEVFTDGVAGLSRFYDLMQVKPDIVEKPDAKDLVVTDGTIDFDHVSFQYNSSRQILSDITLHVNSGEKLAIVGQSGGGKTTLCSLIPRFYDVTKGAIRIDGTDIRDVTKHSLRSSIGVVQQDVFIFADTIKENIRYGRPDASDAQIVAAAKMAEIYDDIMEMPDGFDTYVGERGVRLSGGQKQRISIARIFLKNPKILILDEATSALDTITEQKIQASFDKLAVGRTSLVIAHRLATVKDADRIVLIDEGKIAEMGTHQELLAKNGEYARLYNTQKLFEK
ncbi:MAG: ABC transporter ATP-binding protein/permease [Erysipelotrichaceae bacterium]|nr:ABC transporter ATP-binding protein/permease [Erysipelotrichaceae bacterium]MCI1326935.1 ABC transporter ATP-binding protein/permease [Solobacterium sp.]MCH4044252.1 ABC transporter ATP-binding protein/permease [Erysipelotrichaceae bacterium]MCH4121466.1 ABC transporter ATP-binding protein/permease [Erysipelotrichaceae bacterium]MCI1363677.1 ABC transporter ATP-binding protein/permease [Solobacterium sp.]